MEIGVVGDKAERSHKLGASDSLGAVHVKYFEYLAG
jgi:hypothetical protein